MNLELYIQGGLGNQLYQYAYARYIGELKEFKTLSIYSNSYKFSSLRNLEISNYNLNNNVNFTNKVKYKDEFLRKTYHLYLKIYSILLRKHPLQTNFRLWNKQYVFSCVDANEHRVDNFHNTYLYGYFVSSKVAENVYTTLMSELTLKGDRTKKYIEYINLIKKEILPIIGVSIRCDVDYVDNGWPVCSKDYYKKGIDLLQSEIKNCKVLIFADNIEKVKKENWFTSNVTYIEDLDVCESFELLRNCNHYVCSNSSFSWWASFLTYNSSSIAYHPDAVFPTIYSNDDKRTHLNRFRYLNHLTGTRIYEEEF